MKIQFTRATSRITEAFVAFRNDKSAVTAMEYALIGGLIAVAIVAATSSLAGKISSVFTAIGSAI